MIKIAICDDENIFLEKLSTQCEYFFNHEKMEHSIKQFSSGTELIADIEEKFDLYLLDIILPDYDGLEIAALIRNRNIDSCIIFISSIHEAVYQSLAYQPLRYIRKEKIDVELIEALQAFKHSISNLAYLEINNDGSQLLLPVSSIDYIETDKHYLILHSDEKEYRIRRKLSDFLKEFSTHNFSPISQSFAVNLTYVKSLSSDYIILQNDKQLIPSRSFKSRFKEDFFRYQRRRLNENLL